MKGFPRAMLRPFAAAVAVTMIGVVMQSASAWAQEEKGPPTRRTDAQKQEDAAVDKAYRAATKGDRKLPAVKVDPWRSVRSGDDEKAKR